VAACPAAALTRDVMNEKAVLGCRRPGEGLFITALDRELKRRLAPLCRRTLRKQVLEYIRFTQRVPITQDFLPTDAEHTLYENVTAYLQRDVLHALPASQRTLMTLILRKLLDRLRGCGVEAIRRGETDAALCVATDGTVNPEALIRFSLLSALSTQNDPPSAAVKPFAKNRDGFVMAEGAGALVLESLESATARGARILGVLAGCGELADSFHRTRSSPDGKPIIGCVRNALADAGVVADQIDYINAHGTGTPENDKMEYLGISTVFGERAREVPVSSNKSMVGHTLSAAGAVEAVFSLLTLEHQRIPPTINYDVPDPAIPFDVVPNKARDARVTTVMSNSFGFGGQNASLILTGEPV